MKISNTPHTLTFGRTLTDTELATFAGGVTEGGCIPDPLKDAWKKLGHNSAQQ